jgi:nitric oxide-associated protein 1
MLKIHSIFNRNTKIITSHIIRNYAPTTKITRESIRHELQTSIDAYKEKILYSSFIESNFVKLGYSRNKQLERMLEKQDCKAHQTNAQVQPFPVALKYLYDIADNGKQQNTDEEHDGAEISDEINLPFAKAGVEMTNLSPTPANNWMQDYEVYDENEETDELDSMYGTPDLQQPVSRIPCGGCGAYLHCQDPGLPGYLPSQLFKNKPNDVLKTVTCQRCHFLKNYNTAINVTVKPEDYVQMLSTIEDKFALAILMVDLLDFPCSIWPGIRQILGNKRPIVVVGNKVDLLPRDHKGYLEHIKTCLGQSILDAGFAEANVKHIALISATTGFGVEELINKLHNVWGAKGDVYLVGCTNVGKSSLFNALLQSDYCKVT